MKKKIMMTCCLDCGIKHGTKEKGVIGVWNGTCDICGRKNVPCASAPHDFGIYSNEKIKYEDTIQDSI